MNHSTRRRGILMSIILMMGCCTCFAKNESIFQEARAMQRKGDFDGAIDKYKEYLVQPIDENDLAIYTDALVQMMNTFQSKGEPEACISALHEVYDSSSTLREECLRDFYSVLGYALSRTENMKDAEEATLKALTLPLHNATPERYFRDYAYAAAVFYSNPKYQQEVISWCQEALVQAQLCKNTSGQQWVMSMLGSLYKRNGDLSDALNMFQQSIEESRSRNDELGVLNSLSSLVDLFLYWNIPEYADMYASEAVAAEKRMKQRNPMVSSQTYINKGRALLQLGERDSISFYVEQARGLCEKLPYNSGMVDIDLLDGICMTESDDDALNSGMENLQRVTKQGTAANRAKAYHQLARTYLKHDRNETAETMLDSLYVLLSKSSYSGHMHLDYEPILKYYIKVRNLEKLSLYLDLAAQEQQTFKERSVNYNLVESIVDLQTGNRLQELKIVQLRQANQRLWLMFCMAIAVIAIAAVVTILIYQRKKHVKQMNHADEQYASLVQELNQSNHEKEKIEQGVREFLSDKDNHQERETLTPYILKESGEVKFRQCFEMLYPLFLPRLREKVPSVSRREELLSMLIALKQDNRNIADLLAIAPRSVLMLRHRFRQKIGMTTEYSLENFIEDLLID